MPPNKRLRHRAGKQEKARRKRRRLARGSDHSVAQIPNLSTVVPLSAEPSVPCSSLDLYWGRWDAPYEGDSPRSDIPPFPLVEQAQSSVLEQPEFLEVANHDLSQITTLARVDADCNNNVVARKSAISVTDPDVVDLTDDWQPWVFDFSGHPDQNTLPTEYQPLVELPESPQPYSTRQPQDIPWILHEVEVQASLGPLIDPTRVHPADPRVPVLLRRRELMISVFR